MNQSSISKENLEGKNVAGGCRQDITKYVRSMKGLLLKIYHIIQCVTY